MRSEFATGATGAPSLENSRRARVEASGVTDILAASLVDIAFAVPKRDDVSALAALTTARCAAAGAGCRS